MLKRRCSNVSAPPCGKNSSQKRKRVSFPDDDPASDVEDFDLSNIRDFEPANSPEAGVIESISMTNFMCHCHLEVTLGLNVNFIVGRNGSGKSAILSALIVGLGGSAIHTSRGSSVKSFIKEGCSSATIVITIRNQGQDAFKPAEYGKSIVVERKLLSSGGGYKLKSVNNEVVSTQKRELNEILDQFNIQINNPVSILTQDISRSFLNTSDAKDKYQLFLKATQLERLSEDYDQSFTENSVTKKRLEEKKGLCKALKQEVIRRKNKCREIEELQKAEVLLEEYRRELTWALVAEKQNMVNELREAEVGAQATIAQYQQQLDSILLRSKDVEDRYIIKEEEMNVLNDEATVLCQEKGDLHSQLKQKRTAATKAVQASSRCQRDVERLEKDKECLLARIEELTSASQQDRNEERLRREHELEERMLKQNIHEAQLSATSNQVKQFEPQLLALRGEKGQLQNNLREITRSKNTLRTNLASLQASERDSLSRFGRNTNNIVRLINRYAQEGRFHRKPVGPLGSYIKLKDDKWAVAVENALGRNICGYACHDNHDRTLLKEIFKQSGCGQSEPSVIMGYFSDHLFDTRRNRPSGISPVLTVNDVLEIENHLVANVLIDQCSIETTLLFEDTKVAQRVIWNTPKSYMALTLEGHRVIGGRFSKLYSNKERDVKYFQKDVRAAIRVAEQDIERNEKREKGISQAIRNVEAEIQRIQSSLNDVKRKLSNEQDLVHEIKMQIKELRTYEDVKIPDLDTMMSEVEECDAKIDELTASWKSLNEDRDEKLRESEDAGTLVKDCDERCVAASDKLEKAREEVAGIESQMTTLRNDISRIGKKLEELHMILQQARDAVKQGVLEYDEHRSKALSYCAEVPLSGKSVRILNNLIVNAQENVVNKKQNLPNVDEVIRQYRVADEYFQKIERERNRCKTLNKKLEKSIRLRAERFKDFRNLIEMRAHYCFNMLLSQRGYSGKLKFDHENELLNVLINVENAAGTQITDANALSGGERSLSTVCFIMALWESTEVPVRCLDEFDVFMDMMNRRVAMTNLMEYAKCERTRQFILLTPQDMSHVHGTERVTIFKLSDPEREKGITG